MKQICSVTDQVTLIALYIHYINPTPHSRKMRDIACVGQ